MAMAPGRRRKMGRRGFVSAYVRLWPRDVLDVRLEGERKGKPSSKLAELQTPGLYVLYREDTPYYVGKTDRILDRLWFHADHPGDPRHAFWTHFSAFLVPRRYLDDVEGLLISALPTAANSATRRFPRIRLPEPLSVRLRDARRARANLRPLGSCLGRAEDGATGFEGS
jgi:hypothetical protein